MAWADDHGLALRLTRIGTETDRLPLVLCGPILRRVEPDSVTVWVALKEARTVTLRVYSHQPPPEPSSLREDAQGTRPTVRLGAHLHVVAVTARPLASDRSLAPGTVYFYNLFFSATPVSVVPEDAQEHLNADNVVFLAPSLGGPEPTGLSYSHEHRLPSFSLPPENLNKLRIIHGTCRRPQGPGADALTILDELVANDWPLADDRPHLLLFNGDQIYADDVADSMLFLAMDADRGLLGWSQSEKLPGIENTDERLKPGNRKGIVRGTAKFTTQDPNGHLLRLGEYMAMYLFNWSDALWPQAFPDFREVMPKPPASGEDEIIKADFYKKELAQLDAFRKSLRETRRVLANVPVYMMFDDHDVTDDWNMVRDWCEQIYGNPLARRIVQNALLAYAIFQAWGNTPERFEAGQSGEALLSAAAAWSQSQGADTAQEREIARRVGIPGDGSVAEIFKQVGGLFQLSRTPDALRWDYAIRGPKHEILVLDTRTRREYPQDRAGAPAHLGPSTLEEQVPLDDLDPEKVFVVVATGNVFTIPLFFGTKVYGNKFIGAWWYIALKIILGIFEPLLLILDKLPFFSQIADPQKRTLYNPDLKDSWEPQSQPFESLLSRLARRTAMVAGKRKTRVLILSGDVHFSWAARMQYWADHPLDTVGTTIQPVEAIFGQLTSSPLNKQEKDLGKAVHNWGYIPMTDKLPGAIRWFGWRQPSALGVSAQDMGRKPEWAHMEGWMSRRRPPMLALKEAEETRAFVPKPEWRYRLDYLPGEKSKADFSLGVLAKPAATDHENWLEVFHEAQNRYKEYAQKHGPGSEIVGKNNLAEIRFQWGGQTSLASPLSATDDSFTVSVPDALAAAPLLVKIGEEIIKVGTVDRGTGVCSQTTRAQHSTQAAAHDAGSAVEVFKTATQTHWWRLTAEAKLLPLTRYSISLDDIDPLYPKPKIPSETNP